MNRSGLDEMQLLKRNQIGNQCFLLLLYMLMIDTGLYGFGLRWINYPANIMIILTICSGIYVIRLIAGNAYVGPAGGRERTALRTMLTTLIAVGIGFAVVFLLKTANFTTNSRDNMAAPILFIVAAVAITVAATVAIVSHIQNKTDL